MPMKKPDPIELAIKEALSPGEHIGYRGGWEFVGNTNAVKERIDALIEVGQPQRAVSLSESLSNTCGRERHPPRVAQYMSYPRRSKMVEG